MFSDLSCFCVGFVLKRDKKKDEKEEEISLEELIEKEVHCGNFIVLDNIAHLTRLNVKQQTSILSILLGSYSCNQAVKTMNFL